MKLTPRGAAFVAAGSVGLGLGLALGSLAAGAAGLALLAQVAVAWMTTRAPRGTATRAVSVETTREDAPFRVEVHARFTGGAARVEIEDEIAPGIDVTSGAARGSGREIRFAYEATSRAPGLRAFERVRVRASDALGLVELESDLAVRTAIEVFPRVEEVRAPGIRSRRSSPTSGAHMVGQAGGGSEFFALREYQPGDTMRDVNWRASARTGSKLVVNQREMESQAEVVYFLDARALALSGDVRSCAWSQTLRAIASVGPAHVRARDRPAAFTYGAGEPVLATARAGDPSLASLVRPLLSIVPTGAAGLRDAVEATLPRLRRRGAVVIVSGLAEDVSAPEAVAALRALEMSVTVLALGAPSDATDPLAALGARIVRWGADEPLAIALARSDA